MVKNNVGGSGKSVIQNYSPALFLHPYPADVAGISLMFPKIHWVSRVDSLPALSSEIQKFNK